MVKSCASPARQKWYWILWGRCWGSFLGGWCWSQHTSSWLGGEVVSVTSSNGVRWCCQSDNATGAQCTPRAFDNSHQQKEIEILKWQIEEKKTQKHGCNFLHCLLPLTRTSTLFRSNLLFPFLPYSTLQFSCSKDKMVGFVCLSFWPLGKPGNLSHKLFFNLKNTKLTNNSPLTQKNSTNQQNTQNNGPEWAHLIGIIYHFLVDSEYFQAMESISVRRFPIIIWPTFTCPFATVIAVMKK